MTLPPDQPGDPDQPGLPPEIEQMLRQMLGPQADDVLREIREHGLPGMVDPTTGGAVDLAALAAAAGMPTDPASLGQAMQRIQRMMRSTGDEPVDWELAVDLARQAAVAEGDPTVDHGSQRDAVDALRVAEVWLDQVTDLPASGGPEWAWSRSEWVERTMPTWRRLSEPIAVSVSAALASALASQQEELGRMLGAEQGDAVMSGAEQMLRRLGGAVFGMQLGNAVGTLSREVFGATDVGLPLLTTPGTALLPRTVDEFAEGLDGVPAEEVRIFLALREAAHARLFTHVSWLRGHLLGAVEAYARGITIDVASLEEAVRSIDPTDPEALQEALSGGVFLPHTTSDQKAALVRLETALALVEGWVDEVVAAAAEPHLPHTTSLREMMRRRRAAGGPAEQTFATLVGLELRPRRSRDAARLWAQIAADGGAGARDAVWDHPDLLPTPEDLDDPAGYEKRRSADRIEHADVDRALAEIFGDADAEGDDTGQGGTTT